MKCCSTPCAKHHWSSARPANSGPLSVRICRGRPRSPTSRSSTPRALPAAMCPPQSPGTRAYSHPPRSACAACAPSHEVQRPHLIGGRGRRAVAAAARSHSACAAASPPATLPADRAGRPACDSPASPRVPAGHATGDSQSAGTGAPIRATVAAAARTPSAAPGIGTSLDAVRSARRRVAPRPRLPSASLPSPASASAGLPLFCDHRLQRLLVQRQVRHQVLQPPVLLFQSPQRPRLAHLHPAVLCLPAVEAPLRDAMPATQLARIGPCFRFPQNGDDLFFVEATLAHDSSSALAGYVKGRSLLYAGLISGGRVIYSFCGLQRRIAYFTLVLHAPLLPKRPYTPADVDILQL